MTEVSIPVATMIAVENAKEVTLKQQHSNICDSIDTLRDSYREFCEDDEYETTIAPINHDPEPYANGTKKT